MNSEEKLIQLCCQVFQEDWKQDFPDKEKIRYLLQERGVEMDIIWKAYDLFNARGHGYKIGSTSADDIDNDGEDDKELRQSA